MGKICCSKVEPLQRTSHESLEEKTMDIRSPLPRQEIVIRQAEINYSLRPNDNKRRLLEDILMIDRHKESKKNKLSKHLKREMSKNDVKGMIKTIFEISVDSCSLLAYEDYCGEVHIQKEIIHYRNMLSSQKEQFIDDQVFQMLGNQYEISKDHFIRKASRTLLYPKYLREHILNNYIAVKL